MRTSDCPGAKECYRGMCACDVKDDGCSSDCPDCDNNRDCVNNRGVPR